MWPWKKKQITNVIEYTPQMQQADGYFGALLNSITTIRKTLGGGSYGFSPDGKRNYNQLYGYGESLAYFDYLGMYLRGGIAQTVVAKLPKACWRDNPEIKVGETQILEDELLLLRNKGMFRALERADILNRIGNFSVLLVGIPDGEDLDKPIGTAGVNAFDKIYFNPYSYDGIEILALDNDPASDRFGLPLMYQVQTTKRINGQSKDISVKSFVVHFSRIVHMAEGALESDIEGTSALQAPWNALTDKDKVRGGSGEAYFRNSRQKLALETDKDATVDMDTEAMTALKKNVEGFQNGWEDTLRLDKMKANMLQPGLTSPRDTFDICVEEVAGTTGIPVRFLTTKAGGTVTGSEDKAAWNSLVADRSDQECSPWLLNVLGIFAEAGMLELPDNTSIVWPVQASLNEKEATESISNKAKAFKDVADGLSTIGADEVVAESVFEAVGLEGIEIDKLDLGNDEDDDVPPIDPKDEEE